MIVSNSVNNNLCLTYIFTFVIFKNFLNVAYIFSYLALPIVIKIYYYINLKIIFIYIIHLILCELYVRIRY